jgi:transposase
LGAAASAWVDIKKKLRRAAEQDRWDVAQARDQWRRNQASLNSAKLVFVDETWASTNMTRAYGQCVRGERLVALVPYGHWKVTTFIAGLRHDCLTAPFVIDGPINGEWFLAYVEQVLAPTLSEGNIVVMDNLPAHLGAGAGIADDARSAGNLACSVEGRLSTVSFRGSLCRHVSKPICNF